MRDRRLGADKPLPAKPPSGGDPEEPNCAPSSDFVRVHILFLEQCGPLRTKQDSPSFRGFVAMSTTPPDLLHSSQLASSALDAEKFSDMASPVWKPQDGVWMSRVSSQLMRTTGSAYLRHWRRVDEQLMQNRARRFADFPVLMLSWHLISISGLGHLSRIDQAERKLRIAEHAAQMFETC